MCGIVGIYSTKGSTEKYTTYLNKCMLSMKHRGPNDKGFWSNESSYSAAFVRLSIRDLSINGHQPMVSLCGNFVLSFNGEIYNSSSFINELKAFDVQFKSNSDTEVLLYALIHLGLNRVLNEFDGMFAFAFFNVTSNELIIARDRVGIKPLYIGVNKNYVIYSSQYDHIANIDFIKDNSLNYNSIGNYLSYGYMIGGEAIIKNTFVLPQGHYALVNTNGLIIKKYYDFSTSSIIVRQDLSAEELLAASVKSQMVSDVPVGTFLSGGVDSPLINFWASETQRVNAFTIGSEDPYFNESSFAKMYAEIIGVEHHFKTITESDFLNLLDDNFKAFTEPFADFSSIPTMLVSKMASEHVTVILSGDGPDELFWGYDRNIQFSEKAKLFHQGKLQLAFQKLKGNKQISKRFFTCPSLSSFYLKALQTYGAEIWMKKVYKQHHDYNQLFFQIPEELINPKDEITYMEMVRWLEMNIHLQRILLKVDRATMYYSLEARVPYLSNTVLDYASSLKFSDCIKEQQGKFNVKEILAKKVPEETVFKKKKGFGVPMKDWITKGIKSDVHDTIMNMPSELAFAFDKLALEKMLQNEYDVNNQNSANGFIWAVYALVKWHNQHRKSNQLQ